MLSLLFESPFTFVIMALVFLISLTVHEYAHAWQADKLGDPTARLKGRLTLNPIAHLDPIGTFGMLMFGFGWGKPVPVDTYNLPNPRADHGKISAIGPLTNFVLASVSSLILFACIVFNIPLVGFLEFFLLQMIRINVILGFFNLFPIFPLDGFHIVTALLPKKNVNDWLGLERYGFFILLFVFLPVLGNRSILDMTLQPISRFVIELLVP